MLGLGLGLGLWVATNGGSGNGLPPGYAVLTIGGAAVTDAQGRVYIVREDALQ